MVPGKINPKVLPHSAESKVKRMREDITEPGETSIRPCDEFTWDTPKAEPEKTTGLAETQRALILLMCCVT